MKTQIYCRKTSPNIHSFYLVTGDSEYFMFTQSYHQSNQLHFGKGLFIEDVYDYSKAKQNPVVIHTLRKLPSYIRYIENEHEIVVLKKTQRRKQTPCRRVRYAA